MLRRSRDCAIECKCAGVARSVRWEGEAEIPAAQN
jgi:hypothetical protein